MKENVSGCFFSEHSVYSYCLFSRGNIFFIAAVLTYKTYRVKFDGKITSRPMCLLSDLSWTYYITVHSQKFSLRLYLNKL